jgi:hypothetical protein
MTNTDSSTQKPIFRWTIGDVEPDGFECLLESIHSFLSFYDCEPVVCYNCPHERISQIESRLFPFVRFINQRDHINSCPVPPIGVSWKLYPPRLDRIRHELVIDNDIVLNRRVNQIDQFIFGCGTLLLGETSRTYGRFDKHVPPDRCINSGLYGMPPGFDMQKFVSFYAGSGWEMNAHAEHKQNKTFDEQGLVAFALLLNPYCVIIPHTTITNCEHHLVEGDGNHFIGLNRRKFHRPYHLWRNRSCKMYL